MPQQWAGLRSEPPMSLPSPSGLIPLARARRLAAARTAGGDVRVPRVAGQAAQRASRCARAGRSRAGWCGRTGSPRPRASARPPARRSGRCASRTPARPLVVGRSGDVDVLLDRDRHAVERAEVAAVGDGSVGRSAAAAASGEQGDDGVEVAVDLRRCAPSRASSTSRLVASCLRITSASSSAPSCHSSAIGPS